MVQKKRHRSCLTALRDFSPQNIETLLAIAADPASGLFQFEVRHCGGALARLPQNATACSLREANFYVFVLATAPTPDALAVGKRSIAAIMQALQIGMTGEIMINLLGYGDVGLGRTWAAYPPKHFQRLVALKDTYDPDNVFRFNHNIPPSAADRT